MKRVLVTAIGTVTATAIVKELKKTGSFYLIGADINNQNEIATSLDVNEYYKFPYSTSEDYVQYALEFCKEHSVDYYYAVIDKEVVNISKHIDAFTAIGTKLCVANYDFARICHFKNLFGEWVKTYIPEISIRDYKTIEEVKKAFYPLFIKPIEGVASTGCRKISSYEELVTIVGEDAVGKNIIIQDYTDGRNITVDCIRNKKTGQKAFVARRELLRNSNGCGIAVEIFHDCELENICERLVDDLDLNGVVNIEFFETNHGYKIIEINPRFSAGTEYSCMAGVNTVLNAMKIVNDEECDIGEIAYGAHFAERYEAYRME